MEILLDVVYDIQIVSRLHFFDAAGIPICVLLHPVECKPVNIRREVVNDGYILRTDCMDDVALEQANNGYGIE